MNKGIIFGIVAAVSFIPAGIIAYQNRPADPIPFPTETLQAKILSPKQSKVDESGFTAVQRISEETIAVPEVVIIGNLSRPRSAPGKSHPRNSHSKDCHVRDLVQGSGKVRSCNF